jgi:hypothetical protein
VEDGATADPSPDQRIKGLLPHLGRMFAPKRTKE